MAILDSQPPFPPGPYELVEEPSLFRIVVKQDVPPEDAWRYQHAPKKAYLATIHKSGNLHAKAIATLFLHAVNLYSACEGMGQRLDEYVAELRQAGMNGEATNVAMIAATLRRSAADARGEA